MIPAIKAEFRKLLTVRSTYIITGLSYLMLIVIAFYGEGYKGSSEALTGLRSSLFLAGSITEHSTVLSVFGAVIALLLITQEYRFNTIVYTLTSVNRRSKVLAAKITAAAVYTFGFVLVGSFVGLACMILGVHVAGQSLPSQDISLLAYVGKMLFYGEGWSLAALLLGVLLRNQIAAFVVMLIGPNIGEGLLSLLLQGNAKYLPFSALQQVISAPTPEGISFGSSSDLSPLKGGAVFAVYLVVGWAAAWLLFQYRDAN